MAGPNPNISNGTCYYDVNGESDPRYIPCGNAAVAYQSCCESQDMCLADAACYNAQYGVTYLAGCTDSTYADAACPLKFSESVWLNSSQWVGLAYCNGTSNAWVGCDNSGTGSDTVTIPEKCWCTGHGVSFNGSSPLANIVSLPASLGQSLTWTNSAASSTQQSLASALGFSPASSMASTATSARSSSVSTSPSSRGTSSTVLLPPASGSSVPTSTTAPTSSTTTFVVPASSSSPSATSSGISTGAKAGIAVGAAIGAVAFAVLAWLIYACMRRRSQKEAKAEEPPPMREPTLPRIDNGPVEPAMRSPAWSGHKSELPADESVASASPAPRYHEYTQDRPNSVSEVEGSTPKMSPVRPTHDGGLTVPGQKATFYEMAG